MFINELSGQDYPIYIDEWTVPLSEFLAASTYSSVFVLVDENTKEHCLPIIEDGLPFFSYKVIEISSGEVFKNLDTCQKIWASLIHFKADRRSLLINLGGGVIGDMGGFCASTYKRGIDFVQIPTTLLAQVDASIGSKLGVNFGHIKNSIGLFQAPKSVFIDPVFLQTLPLRELRSGFAEIIKHSLIMDASFWNGLIQQSDIHTISNWQPILSHSLNIKNKIVLQDPYEKNIRKTLNFGHTIGHALESYALQTPNPLLHGEAVAIGMVAAAHLSHQVTGLPKEQLYAISAYILRVFPPYLIPEMAYEDLYILMQNDKKNTQNKVNFTLLTNIGTAVINQTASKAQIFDALSYYNHCISV